MPITGLPSPNVAVNAVGILATPRSTLKPAFSSASASRADDCFSWYPGSAQSQIFFAISQAASALASTDLTRASLSARAGETAARTTRTDRIRDGRMGSPVVVGAGVLRIL